MTLAKGIGGAGARDRSTGVPGAMPQALSSWGAASLIALLSATHRGDVEFYGRSPSSASHFTYIHCLWPGAFLCVFGSISQGGWSIAR